MMAQPQTDWAQQLGGARWHDDPRAGPCGDEDDVIASPRIAAEWARLYRNRLTLGSLLRLMPGLPLATLFDYGAFQIHHLEHGECVVFPVENDGAVGRFLSFRAGDIQSRVTALVAVPLGGARAFALAGEIGVVGPLAPDGNGDLTLYAQGRAWLDRYVAQIEAQSAHLPAWTAIQMMFPPRQALVIDPDAVEWRPGCLDCSLPPSVKRILCPDSAGLAHAIDKALRRRDRLPPLPAVLGPAPDTPARSSPASVGKGESA